MSILAIVITYFPDIDLLNRNISAFIDDVDKVLIWENTPEPKKKEYRFIHHDKVEYCGDGINSISRGLNFGWKYAKEKEYDYLLTMDQDSLFECFQIYKAKVLSHIYANNAIYSPHIKMQPYSSSADGLVDYAITSGMLIPLSVLNKVGGYYETFDIDGIDIDLCMNAKLHGIPTFEVKESDLVQRFGEPYEKKVGNHIFYVNSYSPFRLYSIYKSHVILLRKYKLPSSLKKKFYLTYLYTTPRNVILFENEKFRKLVLIIRGVISGLFFKI